MNREISMNRANIELLTKTNEELMAKVKEKDVLIAEASELSNRTQSELNKNKAELIETKDTYEKKINFINTQFRELAAKPKASPQPEITSQDNRLKKMMVTLKNAKKVVEVQSKYIEELHNPDKRKKVDNCPA